MNASSPKITREFQALRTVGGYRVILADPAWEYRNWSIQGERKNPNQHYETMTLDQICAMPVELLAAKDCALFIWVTWPLMPHWNRVIEAWGFTFSGLAWEWLKWNPDTGKYAFGPGYGTRKNLEPCLLATRGNPSVRKAFSDDFFDDSFDGEGVRSVRDFIIANPYEAIRAPRREHSRKPDEQYDRIETMFSGRYVELFARQPRKGWAAWGYEKDKFPETGHALA